MLVMLAVAAERAPSAATTPEWAGEQLSSTDQREILAFVARRGMNEPRRATVSLPFVRRCTELIVEIASDVTIDGVRRSWSVWRLDLAGRDCRLQRSERNERVGSWDLRAATFLPRQEEWRIEDGTWFVDVRLDGDVSYDDARAMVLALRRQEVVNRLPDGRQPVLLEHVDPASIWSIRRDSRDRRQAIVSAGPAQLGTELWLAVANGVVELWAEGEYRY